MYHSPQRNWNNQTKAHPSLFWLPKKSLSKSPKNYRHGIRLALILASVVRAHKTPQNKRSLPPFPNTHQQSTQILGKKAPCDQQTLLRHTQNVLIRTLKTKTNILKTPIWQSTKRPISFPLIKLRTSFVNSTSQHTFRNYQPIIPYHHLTRALSNARFTTPLQLSRESILAKNKNLQTNMLAAN